MGKHGAAIGRAHLPAPPLLLPPPATGAAAAEGVEAEGPSEEPAGASAPLALRTAMGHDRKTQP